MGWDNKKIFVAVIVIAIILGALLSSYSLFYGPSQFGSDQFSYVYFGWIVKIGGANSLSFRGVLGQKLLINFPIAMFFELFGINALSSSMTSAAYFIGTVIAIYFIGKLLYDYRAGLLAAFSYAMIPLTLFYSTEVSDGIPLAFFASICILFGLESIKAKENKKRILFALIGGFFSLIGFLATAEAIIIVIPFGIILLYYSLIGYLRKEASAFVSIISGIAGFIIAFLFILLIAYALFGQPYLIFKTAGYWYNQSIWVTNGYGLNGIVNVYSGIVAPVFKPSGTGITASLLGYMLPSKSSLPQPYENYYYDWFFYFAVILIAISALRRNKSIAIPLVWIGTTFAYLIFGTMSLSHYALIPPFARYTFIFTPAVALAIGIGVVDLYRNRVRENFSNKRSKKQRPKPAKYKYKIITAFVVVAFAILIFQASYSENMLGNSAKAYAQPFISVANYINMHKPSEVVQSSELIPIQLYTGFKFNYNAINTLSPDCAEISDGAYVVSQSNSTFANECGLKLVAGPFTVNKTMSKYNLLDFDGIWYSYGEGNISIYAKPSK
jgi:hypothetical protein